MSLEKMFFGIIAMLCFAFSGVASAQSYSGYLYVQEGEVEVSPSWSPENVGVMWTVEKTGSVYKYTYSPYVAPGLLDMFVIGTNDSFQSSDILNASAPFEVGGFNLGFAQFTGIGFEGIGCIDHLCTFSFESYLEPVWTSMGMIGVSGDWEPAYGYNVSFGIHPTDMPLSAGYAYGYIPGPSTSVAGPVPEPATYALTIVGLGFIVGALRRRAKV